MIFMNLMICKMNQRWTPVPVIVRWTIDLYILQCRRQLYLSEIQSSSLFFYRSVGLRSTSSTSCYSKYFISLCTFCFSVSLYCYSVFCCTSCSSVSSSYYSVSCCTSWPSLLHFVPLRIMLHFVLFRLLILLATPPYPSVICFHLFPLILILMFLVSPLYPPPPPPNSLPSFLPASPLATLPSPSISTPLSIPVSTHLSLPLSQPLPSLLYPSPPISHFPSPSFSLLSLNT